MSNEGGDKQVFKKHDLEERTAQFGESIIEWCKKLPRNDITKRLIPQIVAAATSVGSNYCEADCAESNKDFIHKMSIANKEAKESKHYVRMLSKACPELADEGRKLWKEAHELNLIFMTIIKKAGETEKKKSLKNSSDDHIDNDNSDSI